MFMIAYNGKDFNSTKASYISRKCILYFIYLYIYVLVYGLFVCNKLLN